MLALMPVLKRQRRVEIQSFFTGLTKQHWNFFCLFHCNSFLDYFSCYEVLQLYVFFFQSNSTVEFLEDSLQEFLVWTQIIQTFNFTLKKYRNLHVLSVKLS